MKRKITKKTTVDIKIVPDTVSVSYYGTYTSKGSIYGIDVYHNAHFYYLVFEFSGINRYMLLSKHVEEASILSSYMDSSIASFLSTDLNNLHKSLKELLITKLTPLPSYFS